MQSIPVDTNPNRLGALLALGVAPDLDQTGAQKSDRDGQPMWKVEALHRPPTVGEFKPKPTVETIKIPGRQPVVDEMSPIEFVGLSARPWEFNGRSGVSLSAEGIAGTAPAKGGADK